MSLSTGTRNLKFMQRAAAQKALNTPTAPSTPSTPVASTPATPTPAGSNTFVVLEGVKPDTVGTPSAATSRSTVSTFSEPSVPLTREEADAMWTIPSRAPPLGTAANGISPRNQPEAGPSRGRFVFEQSYMPFMGAHQQSNDYSESESDFEEDVAMAAGMNNTPQAATTTTSTSAGGGRMTFGNFGKSAKDAADKGEDGSLHRSDGEVDDQAGGGTSRRGGSRKGGTTSTPHGSRGQKRSSYDRQQDEEITAVREDAKRQKIRKMAHESTHSSPNAGSASFARPSNYDPSLTAHSKSSQTSHTRSTPQQPKQSTAERLRNIAASRKQNAPSISSPLASASSADPVAPQPKTAAPPAADSSDNLASGRKSKKHRDLNRTNGADHTSKPVKVEGHSKDSSFASPKPATGSSTESGLAGAAQRTMSLDEREKAMKAQKKKEKKARQKAREGAA